MTKKLIVGGLVLVACLWAVKKTHFMSYAGTIIASGRDSLRNQIPRELEIARVQNEIQRLDRDYQGLLGPIAEKKAAVRRLEKEIDVAKAKLSDRRESLLALTSAIDSKEKEIAYNGSAFTLAQAKVQLAKDFALFKKLEVNVTTQQKLLDAQRQNLNATIEQLGKLVDQKREFEIALAQIQADEEMLRVTQITTPLPTDEGRVADIANTLNQLRQAQDVERERRILEQQYGTKVGDAQPQVPPVGDLTAVRDYLEGHGTAANTKVAQGNK
jgi:chromosome segregation ATPase